MKIAAYQRARIIILCDELGLDESERRDFVEQILKLDGGSIANLTVAEARRVTDALEGARTWLALWHLRPKTRRRP